MAQTTEFYQLSKPKAKSFSVNMTRPGSRNESQMNVSQRYQVNSNSHIWNQSVSTWRNTSEFYSFPKGDRFNIFDKSKRKVQSPDLLPDFRDIPSTRTTKFCTLGKGEKEYLSKEKIKQATLFPSPGYTQTIVTAPRVPNISLGTSSRFHSYTPQGGPPVGTYNIFYQVGKDKPKISMKTKLHDTSQHGIIDFPAPNHYSVNENSTKHNKYTSISFGRGQKMDFSKHDKDIPPVGTYRVYSCFDKFKNVARKVTPKKRKHQPTIPHVNLQAINDQQVKLDKSFHEIDKDFML